MALWTRTAPPDWAPNSVPGKNGWIHPVTNECLVTFGDGTSNKPTPVTPATINSIKRYHGFYFGHVNSTTGSGDTKIQTKTAYTTGDTLKFAVQWTAQVVVNVAGGVPYIVVTINGVQYNATYVQTSFGTETATSMFYLKLPAGAFTTSTGQVTVASPIVPNGATIKTLLDSSSATLTFSTTGLNSELSQVVVTNGSSVTVPNVLVANATHFTSAGVLAMTAGFSNQVNYTPGTAGTSGIPVSFTVGGGVASAGTAGVATGLVNTIVFKYTIKGNTVDSAGTGGVTVVSPILVGVAGSLVDVNGNTPQETFTPPTTNTDYVN